MTAIKAAVVWPLLLLIPSVICRSFVIQESEKQIWKRDVAAVETNSTNPDIYSFEVTSNISYRYAVTRVSNRVANPANVSKEISFLVTLPDSAFISKFLMVIQDKVYEAYVKEKEEAKKVYQEAVEHGYTAGLVSMNARDSNVFTVSVNVEAHGKVTFNLTYEQLLARTLGQYENIINVKPGQIVKSFNVHVNIEESSNITSLHVSDLKTSNEIDSTNTKSIDAKIERPSGESAKISWSPDAKQQQELSADGVAGQFIVQYDVDRTAHPNQILINEGYFVEFFSPIEQKPLPKHVLFVMDISGSMGGRKIEQLREAMELILADIGEGDHFSILLFSDSVQLWTLNGTVGEASPPIIYEEVHSTAIPEIEVNGRFIVPATPENIKKATEFAKNLQETGGTNIIAALRKALEIAKWGQKQGKIKAKPLIIFLTDGQPNVEMSDPEEINKNVNKLNPDKYALFSLGFGQGADFDFLRKLSLSNSGFARNIYVASDTTLQLKNFYKEVASPLLSNVKFEYIPGQVSEGYVTKQVFSNLYNGSELVVAGKLSNDTKALGGNVTYEGVDGFFCVPLPSPLDIPVKKPRAHLENLFAYLYIKELLDKDLISDEKNSTYKQKALKLSLEYGFVTPLTSLVVVKPNETESGASIKNHNSLSEEGGSYSLAGAIRGPSSFAFSPANYAAGNVPGNYPLAYHSMSASIKPKYESALLSFDQDDLIDSRFQIAPRGSMLMMMPMPVSFRRRPIQKFQNSWISGIRKKIALHKQSYQSPIRRPVPAPPAAYFPSPTRIVGGHRQPLITAGNSGFALAVPMDAISTPFPPAASAATYATTNVDSAVPEAGETTTTVTEGPLDVNVTGFNVPYNLSNIAWLQNKTEIKFPNSNNSYSVFVGDLPNIEYQSCMIPNSNNTLGHCRHLVHCIIPQILSLFTDFIPYGEQCVIDARFVGICCPKQFNQKLESTTGPSNTSIPTLAPLLQTTVTA